MLIRILLWINRFSHDTKSKEKQVGPLKTDEINKSIERLIKREQCIFETIEPIQNDMKQLNLVKIIMKSTNVRVEFKVTTLLISQEIANWQRKLHNISIKRPFMGELSWQ